METYILAHNLGTSGDKATLFSTEGKLIDSLNVSYPLYTENVLYAEQDAEDLWRAVCESTKGLLHKNGVSGREVKAISFSGQMMACLPVDKEGIPLRRMMIWADRRAGEEAARLADKIDDSRFYSIVGHHNSASYGIQKAMWFKGHEPELYERTEKFLNAKDYIVLKLTGKWFTDCSDANSMGCFDLAGRCWSQEIVEASGIHPEKLPEIVDSTYLVGTVTKEAAFLTGLSEETKVVMGAGDGVAANVGAGSVMPGKTYCCLGTSAWVATTSEKPVLDPERRVVCWAHAVPGLYSPNGTMQYAGGSYAWMKETLCEAECLLAKEQGCSPYELINERIEACAPGADGVVFLPYLMGERAPRWNADAQGVFFGLRGTTTKDDMLRSVLEGIVMNMAIIFDILKKQVEIEEITLIGGAARSSAWQRTVADVFDTKVWIPNYLEEANSLGAAVIAGVGSGIYKDFSAIDKFLSVESAVKPDKGNAALYRGIRLKFDRIYEALKGVF